jgi:hypothetical protein
MQRQDFLAFRKVKRDGQILDIRVGVTPCEWASFVPGQPLRDAHATTRTEAAV